jgi:hypothetical protein
VIEFEVSLKLVRLTLGALAIALASSVLTILLQAVLANDKGTRGVFVANDVAIKNASQTPLEVHVTNAPSSTLSRFGTLHARGRCVRLVGRWDDETMRGKKVVNAQVAAGACRTSDGEPGVNIVVFWQD